MHRYTVYHENPNRNYIKILFEAKASGSITDLCLPVWRPGRYELQNYAKNIRNVSITDENGVKLSFKKTSKSVWQIHTIGAQYIRLSYEYYAHVLDAGASFFNETQLYMNPCNCMMYILGKEGEICELHLKIPEHYQVACSLPEMEKNVYRAKDFHSLADSPFIASPSIKHSEFRIDESHIHLWFQGDFVYPVQKVIDDFTKYSRYQKEIFNALPSSNYHYFFQMLPVKFHHGVEHMNNTVIALGPDKNFDRKEFYNEFLAISSHEFFHLWNVKRIRPEEMWPYDYTKENYAPTGWIYEGVTTYYGDIALLRSCVFDFDDWAVNFNKHLQKHFDNEGRYNYSVADSSFDTWLDGYSVGAPGRKVNIYTEGMLSAFILDIYIMQCSDNQKSLDDVMRVLYQETWLKNKGYTQEMYQRIAEQICGRKLDWYFNNVINGCGYIEKYLPEAFEYVGLEMTETETDYIKNRLGIVYTKKDTSLNIQAIWPGSPADAAGMDADFTITHINGQEVAVYPFSEIYTSDEISITGHLSGNEKKYILKGGEIIYYPEVKVRQTGNNLENYITWSTR